MNRCKNRQVMSIPKERDEQEALKLDENFKEILVLVRPYIVSLTSKEDAQFCKVWLEKLSTVSTQRNLRNEYLLELYRQLSFGQIESIFRKPPPNGPLIPLPIHYRKFNSTSSLTDITDSSSASYYLEMKPNLKSSQRKFSKSKASLRRRDTDTTSNASLSLFGDDQMDKTQLQLYRQKIETLTDIVQELQIQNERLDNELFQCQEKISASENPSLKAKVKQMTDEISALKDKLKEMQQMKDVLEESHREIVQQYQETMSNQFNKLKARLKEAQNKNIVLDDNIFLVTQKLEEVTREKEEKAKMVEKEWSKKCEAIHKDYEATLQKKDKELQYKDEIINQKGAELTKKDLVKREEIISLINQIKELESKLEVKIQDEGKLQNMLEKQYSAMKEEFTKMRNDIEFTSQKQNEGLINEVVILRKNILKLEKSKERLTQKLSQVLKDKELEIKSLQIQLQGQRSELSMSLNSEKQNELDSLVDMLEKRYKTLLTAVDVSADNQRQNYLRKIVNLEHQVSRLKNNLISLADRGEQQHT